MSPFTGELGETWDPSLEPLPPEPVSLPLHRPTSLLSPASSSSSLAGRGKGLRAEEPTARAWAAEWAELQNAAHLAFPAVSEDQG